MIQLLEELSTKSKEITTKVEDLLIASKLMGHEIEVSREIGKIPKIMIHTDSNNTIYLYFSQSARRLEKLTIYLHGETIVRDFERYFGRDKQTKLDKEIRVSLKVEKKSSAGMFNILHTLMHSI